MKNDEDPHLSSRSANPLVLFLHHVGGIGLLNGLCEELVQRRHELPEGKTSDEKNNGVRRLRGRRGCGGEPAPRLLDH